MRTISILSIVFTSLGYIYTNSCYSLCKYTQKQEEIIKTGDIFFSIGKSLKSSLVMLSSNAKNTKFSHTGFIKKDNNKIYVIHMDIEKGHIVKEAINDFIPANKVEYIEIYRTNNPLENTISAKLKYHLDTEKKFDYNFELKDTNTFYCTQLIYNILKEQGYKIKINPNNILYPNDLLTSTKLNHITTFN